MELSAAEKDPGYITRFPVLLDGSCNGIQHLALMTRDEEAGRLVNLTNADEIFDLYSIVESKVVARPRSSGHEPATPQSRADQAARDDVFLWRDGKWR